MKNFDFRIYTKRNDIKNNMCVVKDFYGDEIICEHEYRFKFSEVELMQFTGLKDCNGVKIYEGDIVKYISDFYEVKFIDGAFVLKNIKDNTFFVSFFENPKTAGICIVVGNIYQNKDLLKWKKTQ